MEESTKPAGAPAGNLEPRARPFSIWNSGTPEKAIPVPFGFPISTFHRLVSNDHRGNQENGNVSLAVSGVPEFQI
jgi:hypothetical protein